MRTTIDRAGRVVIPKAMRESLGLHDGGEIEIREIDGGIEITVAPAITRIEITKDGPVFAADAPVPELTDDIVRAALESARR